VKKAGKKSTNAGGRKAKKKAKAKKQSVKRAKRARRG